MMITVLYYVIFHHTILALISLIDIIFAIIFNYPIQSYFHQLSSIAKLMQTLVWLESTDSYSLVV